MGAEGRQIVKAEAHSLEFPREKGSGVPVGLDRGCLPIQDCLVQLVATAKVEQKG